MLKIGGEESSAFDGYFSVIERSEESLKYPRRDAFFEAVELLRSPEALGHALGIMGLRKTGKSVLLDQLHASSELFGVEPEQVLHIRVNALRGGKPLLREELNKETLFEDVSLPDVTQLLRFVQDYQLEHGRIRCLLIDEITLCGHFSQLPFSGVLDYLFGNAIKVVVAGSEKAYFNYSKYDGGWSKLVLMDISYIPFGEYVRLKKLPCGTPEEKLRAIETYLARGNVPDDSVKVDEAYLRDAVAFSTAFSAVCAEDSKLLTHTVDELEELLLKSYKEPLPEPIISGIWKDDMSGLEDERCAAANKLFGETELISWFWEISADEKRIAHIKHIHMLYSLFLSSVKKAGGTSKVGDADRFGRLEDVIHLNCIKRNLFLKRRGLRHSAFCFYNKIYRYCADETGTAICDQENREVIVIDQHVGQDSHGNEYKKIFDEVLACGVQKLDEAGRVVIYPGETMEKDGIRYYNAADYLLEEYDRYFRREP